MEGASRAAAAHGFQGKGKGGGNASKRARLRLAAASHRALRQAVQCRAALRSLEFRRAGGKKQEAMRPIRPGSCQKSNPSARRLPCTRGHLAEALGTLALVPLGPRAARLLEAPSPLPRSFQARLARASVIPAAGRDRHALQRCEDRRLSRSITPWRPLAWDRFSPASLRRCMNGHSQISSAGPCELGQTKRQHKRPRRAIRTKACHRDGHASAWLRCGTRQARQTRPVQQSPISIAESEEQIQRRDSKSDCVVKGGEGSLATWFRHDVARTAARREVLKPHRREMLDRVRLTKRSGSGMRNLSL